jgi:16S rRNA (cytosine1402-N4)-methyltransferase
VSDDDGAEGTGYHEPVMLEEVLAYLQPERGGLYFDGTVGGGGHSAAILETGAESRVIGVDQDPEAIARAAERLEAYEDRVELVHANYVAAAAALAASSLAGALLDLGISSRHIDEAERGFSFRSGTPLDMRMSGPGTDVPSAADLLNTLPEAELANLFYRYGEERQSRRLAAEVVRRRGTQPFAVSDDLLEAMAASLRGRLEAQDRARIFQALRIAVNDELGVLAAALPLLRDALAPGGVIVVLAYHSLEDRLVKDAFREWSRSCVCPPELPVCRCRGHAFGRLLTRKPARPTALEVQRNVRSRSARLRAWQKAA